MVPNTPNPYLYILMRNDLDSLNPGKMVAQGAHAANQFTFQMGHLERWLARTQDSTLDPPEAPVPLVKQRQWRLYDQWVGSTKSGFGVTITLGVTEAQLRAVVGHIKAVDGPMCADITHDPTYPLVDGKITHLIPLDTCGYVFGEKDELRIVLGQFNLLP